ncbi:aminotransferase class I/II-fold pyridoxal phosphate-dependent enzyme [Aquibacillus sediminis]|uniref:aminotransferase class I/II-fold pyridoxal phosphate-dependent enzyme n=1 Tax=Aquibacillus sediminis TaxID=2574734 RepID=UPI001107DEC7|nr:aminotransferase class I/II-fold pyridoxal phosphate-dependent enzyme [Aquibacillus sediminis]
MKELNAPLYNTLVNTAGEHPISFHVPGHKNGEIFCSESRKFFENILPIDLTELPGLDDLHAPTSVIAEAQQLAASWFGASQTYFLVGGTTVGNLAMALATCDNGDKVIVQRNCHKSVLNGLELSQASPIFLAPEYDGDVNRYTSPDLDIVRQAIDSHKDAKAIVLTYPDYFGRTYDIQSIIKYAHQFHIPVLVDEAHGVHFSVDDFFPPSSLELGADVVVQSAHKTAPAMTMGSYMHVNSKLIAPKTIEHYLQLLQSSSPSYPLMASLDLARYYLEQLDGNNIANLKESISRLRAILNNSDHWEVQTIKEQVDDPLKITLETTGGYTGHEIANQFETFGIYPELATNSQVLFIHGLASFHKWSEITAAIEKINQQLKIKPNHATIDDSNTIFKDSISRLVYTFPQMRKMKTKLVSLQQSEGQVVAESIIPYPPGVPLLYKGERITMDHINMIQSLLNKHTTFQNQHIHEGVYVFV